MGKVKGERESGGVGRLPFLFIKCCFFFFFFKPNGAFHILWCLFIHKKFSLHLLYWFQIQKLSNSKNLILFLFPFVLQASYCDLMLTHLATTDSCIRYSSLLSCWFIFLVIWFIYFHVVFGLNWICSFFFDQYHRFLYLTLALDIDSFVCI